MHRPCRQRPTNATPARGSKGHGRRHMRSEVHVEPCMMRRLLLLWAAVGS
jgi:hypothetical protein